MSRKFSFKDLGAPEKFSFKSADQQGRPEKFSFKNLSQPANEAQSRKFSFKDLAESSRPPSPDPYQPDDDDQGLVPLGQARQAQLELTGLKKTGIFLTVNTNRKATAENVGALNDAMRHMLDAHSFSNYLINSSTQGPLMVPGNITVYKQSWNAERGGKFKRLHAHGLVSVKYARRVEGQEQKLFFKFAEFKKDLETQYANFGGRGGLPYISFQIRGLSAEEGYVYIHKDGQIVLEPANVVNVVREQERKRGQLADGPKAQARQARAKRNNDKRKK